MPCSTGFLSALPPTLTGLAAQAPPFKAGVSRLYVSLVLYILLHDGEWGAAYGGDEVAVGPQGGDPAFE